MKKFAISAVSIVAMSVVVYGINAATKYYSLPELARANIEALSQWENSTTHGECHVNVDYYDGLQVTYCLSDGNCIIKEDACVPIESNRIKKRKCKQLVY